MNGVTNQACVWETRRLLRKTFKPQTNVCLNYTNIDIHKNVIYNAV